MSAPGGEGGANRLGGAGPVHLVLVAEARPEEAAQAVVLATGEDVHVQVRHALADAVVDPHEGAVGLDGHPHRPAQPAGGVEQGADQL